MKSTDELADAIDRMTRALGRRLAGEDPDALVYLRLIERAATAAWIDAIDGLRASGFSDAAIARELGVTRQAVTKRWARQAPAPRGRQAQGFR